AQSAPDPKPQVLIPLIQSGSPAIYKLKLNETTVGTLRRKTLGKRSLNKINKTILLVGETGTGKSTLINVLVNYVMGVEWEDDVWFEIVEDEQRRQSQSQTSDVVVYQIFGFEGETLPYSLTIIDTPGYGDTRDDKSDDIISKRLLDCFSSDDGVHEINVVGLVLKATDNRLSDRLRYVFDSVVSLFGKNMEKNIVALMTHSDGGPPEDALKALEDAKIKCSKNGENQPLHFLFNNRQSKERTRQFKMTFKFLWDFTVDQISQFTDFLTKTEPQKLNTTLDVMKKRIKLTACIINLQKRIEFIELKQTQIQAEQKLLEKYKEKMKKNEKFCDEVDEPYKVKEPIEGGHWGFLWLSYKGAISCLVCEETCHHEGCIHSWSPNDSCCVIFDDNGNCTACTEKCRRSVHVKEEWIYVNKTRKVTVTNETMKRKYEENKAGTENQLSLLEKMERKMEELQNEKHKWLEESFQHIVTLEGIALHVDSLFTLVHLDFLIEKMEDIKYQEKKRANWC
uniref:AIG1-type G domain-containing protein n=1 Tax=Mola mola TaxID=94237 RepID=A0A3Q3WZ48_MOLML